jgi:hypothetical protein
MSLIHKLRVFRSLGASNRAVALEALALPVCIAVSFRMLGVARTQGLLRWWASEWKTKAPGTDNQAQIRNTRRGQQMIRRSTGVGGSCLVRSLTLWTMLLRRGVSTDLRVGFRKRNGRTEGHAWVEYESAPINEDVAETVTFVPYDRPVSFDLWRRIG